MKYIDLKVKPFQQYTEAPKPGILVTNPPYGERISSRDLLGLYNMIGERLKHVFMGYKAWILSYKDECFDKIGLRPSEKIKLMNGSLECEYRCYELFEGTNKDFKKALNEDGEERPRRSEGSFERRGNDRQNFRTVVWIVRSVVSPLPIARMMRSVSLPFRGNVSLERIGERTVRSARNSWMPRFVSRSSQKENVL